MIAALLLAVLAQAPDAGRPGEFDAPVLIDLAGRKTELTDGKLAASLDDPQRGCYSITYQCMAQGTVCLTYDKAASIRDDLADKNARLASTDSALAKTDPAILKIILFTAAGFLAGGAVAAGVVCGTGHCR